MQVYRGMREIGLRLGVDPRTALSMIVNRGFPAWRTSGRGMWVASEGLIVAWELEATKIDRRFLQEHRSKKQCANERTDQKPNSTERLETTDSNPPNEDGQTS